ncbi:MAG: NUDIX domain-containing protein [Planctomycetota bacterium]|nr:NUDIX domain-containing protein [Planctomycetota bacterium]MCB9825461.1 NUDIX domain-containing protein [Planctomycetota bacterium]MCB9900555.1 NUDIX domain-containing protein [Planctomycetota bacterium]
MADDQNPAIDCHVVNVDLHLTLTAVAVIRDADDRVLLTRRADNGLWCLPSGHMEIGETIEGTAVREAREETGLDVITETPVGVYSAPHPYYALRGRQVVALVFLCRVVGGRLRPSEETTAFGWFSASELPDDIVPTHPQRIVDAMAVRSGAPFFLR